jgi:hypothetical protein
MPRTKHEKEVPGGRINVVIVKPRGGGVAYGAGASTHAKLVKAVFAAKSQDAACLRHKCEDAIEMVESASTNVSALLQVVNAVLQNHGGGLNDYIDELVLWGNTTLESLSRACESLKRLCQKLASKEERDGMSVMNEKVQTTNVAIECVKEQEHRRPLLPDWAPQAVIEHMERACNSLQQVAAVESFAVGSVKDPKDPFQKRTVQTTVTWTFGSGDPIPPAWRGEDNI